jgi:hypothetical protein
MAKHERMSTVVAVSRSPQRSAAHSSGSAARKASALLSALSSNNGLNAISPTKIAATMARLEDNALSTSKARKLPIAQSTAAGATTNAPAASRSHHAALRAMRLSQSRYPAR